MRFCARFDLTRPQQKLFEPEAAERFARWIGGEEWRERGALDRLRRHRNGEAGGAVKDGGPSTRREFRRHPEHRCWPSAGQDGGVMD